MIQKIFYVLLLSSFTIFGQVDEKIKVKLAVDTFFEGFHKGDTALMKTVIADKILMQTAYRNKEGKDILVTDNIDKLINAIADRPVEQKWDERLLDYNIQVNGNMANAWTPYEFWFMENLAIAV